MMDVSTERVGRLRGMLHLAQIERAAALASGDHQGAERKDAVVAQLEDHLAGLEWEAEDIVAGRLLPSVTAQTMAARAHRRD